MDVMVRINTPTIPLEINVSNLDVSRVTDPKNEDLARLLISSWLVLLSDSPVLCNKKPYRTYRRFLEELCGVPVGESIAKYTSLSEKLLRSSYTEGALTRVFLPEMLDTPISYEYIQWYNDGDGKLLQFILSFLTFGKKTEFDLEAFNQSAFRGWESIEERLQSLEIDQCLMADLKLILSYLFPEPLAYDYFMGKHGPGAVAGDERGVIEKSSQISLDSRLRRIIHPYGSYMDRPGTDERDVQWITDIAHKNPESSDVSRLMFVPKNYKTARSICMEPTSYMFFQQAIAWEMHKLIDKSLIGQFVRINDQSRNQQGATYGAYTGDVDTIDLSAASDSVHIDLVKGIFPRHMLRNMMATRTPRVEVPDGSIREVSKFAPMGSALCFPTQSIIFASVVLLAYVRYFGGESSTDILSTRSSFIDWIKRNVSREFISSAPIESLAVYGDDIICDHRVTYEVVSILTELGFSVNTEKSFYGDASFRESCGIYSYEGIDVTPFTFKMKHLRGGFDAKSFTSLVSLCNRSGDYGYRNLHSFLIRFLKGWHSRRSPNPVLFSSNREKGNAIYSMNPHNVHLRTRINEELQRAEYKTWLVTPQTNVTLTSVRDRDGHLVNGYDGENVDTWYQYELHMFYRAGVAEREDDYSHPPSALQGLKIRWGWTPAY